MTIHSNTCFPISETQLESNWREIYGKWPQEHCKSNHFYTPDKKKIGFLKCGNGNRPLVFVPGYTEPALKYLEVVYDFIHLPQGYGPIFVMDLPGQGASERLSHNPNLVHVDGASRYTQAFAMFLSQIVKEYTTEKPSIIAHSTGALIALASALRNPDLVESIVTLTPLIRPKLPIPAWLVQFFSSVYVGLSLGHEPVWGRSPKTIESQIYATNKSTQSIIRWNISHTILSENPELYTHGLTWGWMDWALQEGDHLLKHAKDIKTPILMVLPRQDELVELSVANRVCKTVQSCQLREISTDKHETLQLTDDLRNIVFSEINAFNGGL